MKTIGSALQIMISIILISSCEKKIDPKTDPVIDPVIDQENVKTTSYFDYDNFITDGLIAYYPFNGNANDSIGNGLDGMAYSVSYSPDRFNQPNRACYFNGNTSYIKIDNSALLNGNKYTICFWYRADLTDTLPQSIISKSDTARYGFTLGISNLTNFSDLSFTYKDNKTGVEFLTSLGLSKWWTEGSAREFDFAAYAFSETENIAYIGGHEGKLSPALFFNSNNYNLYFGKSENGRYKNFKGELDDLLIYNRILTYEEVEKLRNWTKK